MQYTENYNLNKPELTDVADITKLSDNMDIIDEELEKRTTKLGFLTDLITHLASDAAITIQSLSTDSIFYRLLSYALEAAGVQYNFQNSSAWYICLGALFGGLIIQGGNIQLIGGQSARKAFPITFANSFNRLIATVQNDTANVYTVQGFCTQNEVVLIGSSAAPANWIAMGL